MDRYITDRDIATQVVDATLRDGGATYRLDLEEWLTASTPVYVVGGAAPGDKIDVRAFGSNDVVGVIETARERGADGIGTWVDDGHVYVDVVDLFDDREVALQVARERGELAVWDAANGVEIRTADAA